MTKTTACFLGSTLLLTGYLNAATDIVVTGAGATFPAPLYQQWIETYRASSDKRVSYLATGSGDGITRLLGRQVDFGATDAFLTDSELRKEPSEILHIPTCLGAVAITYNLPGAPQLRFTPEILAEIFLGQITNWSDKRLRQINATIQLPDQKITLIHRSDGSGTTFLFTDYLSKISPEWEKKVGSGKHVRWATGMGVDGNGGVARFIGRISGSIGYLEHTYAAEQRLPIAELRNKSGFFIMPSMKSVQEAAQVELPDDLRVLITDTPAPQGYPISGFTYILCHREQSYDKRTREQAIALQSFITWVVTDGQNETGSLTYAPLPQEARVRALNVVQSLTFRDELLAQPAGRPR